MQRSVYDPNFIKQQLTTYLQSVHVYTYVYVYV